MIVKFDKSFIKALDKIKDKAILKKIELTIQKVEAVNSFENLSNIKKRFFAINCGFRNFRA